METIPKSECARIGFIRKLHGVHGEVVLEFEEHYENSISNAERFFIELEGLLVPFFIAKNGFRLKSGKSALVIFDDVKSEAYAKRFVGQQVYLFSNEVNDENEEFSSDWNNYTLVDENRGEIGTILDLADYSGNIVLTVDFGGKEILIPFNEDFLVEVDNSGKKIILKIPEGLIPD